jgi:hypothetical protein
MTKRWNGETVQMQIVSCLLCPTSINRCVMSLLWYAMLWCYVMHCVCMLCTVQADVHPYQTQHTHTHTLTHIVMQPHWKHKYEVLNYGKQQIHISTCTSISSISHLSLIYLSSISLSLLVRTDGSSARGGIGFGTSDTAKSSWGTIWLWYGYDMVMIWLWYGYDMVMICSWYGYDIIWYGYDMVMIWLRYGYDMAMIWL